MVWRGRALRGRVDRNLTSGTSLLVQSDCTVTVPGWSLKRGREHINAIHWSGAL